MSMSLLPDRMATVSHCVVQTCATTIVIAKIMATNKARVRVAVARAISEESFSATTCPEIFGRRLLFCARHAQAHPILILEFLS
jgi:hypothetical protein